MVTETIAGFVSAHKGAVDLSTTPANVLKITAQTLISTVGHGVSACV
ncbi:hypothetical protein NY055_05585 [Corynebacterium diphtheriae bv. mitis]|nr:hypothetical protein NY055_05585 [Corynebacterium diphtheriae bv. mitis]